MVALLQRAEVMDAVIEGAVYVRRNRPADQCVVLMKDIVSEPAHQRVVVIEKPDGCRVALSASQFHVAYRLAGNDE